MIPKKIHYCWFGRGEKPELALKCIESWKKYCPDYEIIEWNEDNFDINSNRYVREAYEAKKFAFVSDYVRLWVMTKFGGIYMDTDVEVVKPLDFILKHDAVSGFESKTQIPTGLMACRDGFALFEEFLRYYDTALFKKPDGTLNLTTNVTIMTEICYKHGFVPNGEYQEVAGFALYPQNVFCPDHKKLKDRKYMKDTATIHYFAGSWKSDATKKREAAPWWRLSSVPAMAVSKVLKCLLGERWVTWKNKVRDKVFADK